MTPHSLSAEEVRRLGSVRVRTDVGRSDTVAGVRNRVRALAAEAFSGDRLADVLLATSELVSNSLLHAPPGPITVWAGLDARRLRVEVHDGGPGLGDPAPFIPPDVSRIGGRGLALVRALADRTGHRDAPRAMVWFEMDVERR